MRTRALEQHRFGPGARLEQPLELHQAAGHQHSAEGHVVRRTVGPHSYLVDAQNGLVCAGSSVEALRSTLLRALDLPRDKMMQQRLACRQLAEQAFDYRVHSKTLAAFFRQVGAPAGEPRQSQM